MAKTTLRPPEVRGGEVLTPGKELSLSALFAGPGVLWIALLLLLPGLVLLLCSFLSRGDFGEVEFPLTWDNYLRFMGYGPLGWTPVYWEIVWRSLVMAVGTTLLCAVLAYPLAFFIAAHPERTRNLLLTLVIVPFWTNLVIRTYAWMLIFAPEAWPAQLAARLGLTPPDTALYPSDFAVYVGMVNAFLPFLVLPLYTAVERLDWTLVEAAQDLYANRWQVFTQVLLPQTLPGLVAGLILVSVPAFGMFVVPDLLGGSKTILIGNAIQQQFGSSLDYPFGAALSFLVTSLTLAVLYAYSRYAGERGLRDLI
ncbi:ABC transporter permease [Anthocerotibacter panamensis]|uniref:ABC transporter permease n=1 Tax=Anthocerotibacter panamensis TaxID=2857077 RepID=UPI001C404DE2|nr:ABC transporter permease [Anthocerotibacter panamensis]